MSHRAVLHAGGLELSLSEAHSHSGDKPECGCSRVYDLTGTSSQRNRQHDLTAQG